MINPATELANLFAQWSSPDTVTSVYSARGGQQASPKLWKEQGRAVILLKQVEEVLDTLRRLPDIDTEPFDRYVVDWYEGMFQPERSWSSAFAGDAALHASVGSLRSLGTVINLGGVPGRLSDIQRESVLNCVSDAIELLDSPSGEALATTEREYVYRLLSETRSSLEEKIVVGGMDLRANIDRLNGALLGVAAQFNAIGDSGAAQQAASTAGRIVQLVRGIIYDVAAIAQIAGTAFGFIPPALGAGDAGEAPTG
jgi:hypothetical protein